MSVKVRFEGLQATDGHQFLAMCWQENSRTHRVVARSSRIGRSELWESVLIVSIFHVPSCARARGKTEEIVLARLRPIATFSAP